MGLCFFHGGIRSASLLPSVGEELPEEIGLNTRTVASAPPSQVSDDL